MNASPTTSGSDHQQSLPAGLKLFLIATVLFGIFHIYTFIQVLLNYQELAQFDLGISTLYLGVEGLLWGVIGLFLAWSILTRKPWVPLVGSMIIALYAIYFWTEQIFIARPELITRRWPVNLTVTILGLALSLGSLHHQASRAYFGKNPVKIP